MKSTIQAANLEVSKDEIYTLLVEINEVLQKNQPADKNEDHPYPMLKRFREILNNTWDVHVISEEKPTFRILPRQ